LIPTLGHDLRDRIPNANGSGRSLILPSGQREIEWAMEFEARRDRKADSSADVHIFHRFRRPGFQPWKMQQICYLLVKRFIAQPGQTMLPIIGAGFGSYSEKELWGHSADLS